MRTLSIRVLPILLLCAALQPGCGRSSDDYVRSGISHAENHQYAEARADFDKAIALDSTNARAYLRRALVQLPAKVGRTSEDVERINDTRDADLNRYIALTEPDLALAYVGRALSKRLHQDFPSAFGDLDKAIAVYPVDIQGAAFKVRFLEESRDSVRLKAYWAGLDEQTRARIQAFRQ